ncbi:MAG: hypothetical protein R3C03_05345 [Pirellulaceae bacterium]
MAARENQGYLIAVISLVLLSLVLALVAFLGVYSAFTNNDEAEQANAELANTKRLMDGYEILSQIQSAAIGELDVGAGEIETLRDQFESLINQASETNRVELNQIKAKIENMLSAYDKNKEVYIGTPPEGEAITYVGLVRNFSSALGRSVNDSVVTQSEMLKDKIEKEAELVKKQEEVDNTKIQLEAAQSDLTEKTDEFESYKVTMSQTLEDIQKRYNDVEKEKDDIRKKLSNDIDVLSGQLTEAETRYADAKARLDIYEKENWDLADGKIVRVARSKENLVFLDIGKIDGLKTTRTFSVYDSSTNNFEKGSPKAAIEVTRVWDDRAEARITNEDPLDPILENDLIINPVWDPGYSVPIAIAGVFDLDHDGFDDRERLIRLIEQNGGTVVAWNDDDGNIQGKVDSATRWFVLGAPPVVDVDSNPEVVRSIRKLRDEAEKYQIQEIDTRKLLNWMGQHSQPQIERLDRGMGFEKRSVGSSR